MSDYHGLLRYMLADRLRLLTKSCHSEAESGFFTKALPLMLCDKLFLITYHRRLLLLHEALEQVINKIACLTPLFPWAELQRSSRLRSDIASLELRWDVTPECEAETTYYASYLYHLADTEPLAVAGHAYVRYLGDLYGGQFISRLIRLRYGLPKSSLAHAEFGDSSLTPRLLISQFRNGLNALPSQNGLHERILEEASEAFRLTPSLWEQNSPKPAVSFPYAA